MIYPEKLKYKILRAQGINGEPFVPLVGQISQLFRYREANKLMDFYEELVKKHGEVFVFGYGPLVRLMVNFSVEIMLRTTSNPPLLVQSSHQL